MEMVHTDLPFWKIIHKRRHGSPRPGFHITASMLCMRVGFHERQREDSEKPLSAPPTGIETSPQGTDT